MKTTLFLLRSLNHWLVRSWVFGCLLIAPLHALEIDQDLFPQPDVLRPNIRFWTSIYTLYDSDQIVIHDSENLSIIYEVIDLDDAFPEEAVTEKAKWNYADSVKDRYCQILKKLASADTLNPDTLHARERYVYNLFHENPTPETFLRAIDNIRGQQGLRDQFREGLIRSGRYAEHINRIFREFDLPLELAALPFVESLFHVKSYSKVGAAGIWQFTRRTGRRFLKINYTVDERFDPISATVAAAKLLKENYEKLGNWPLAITAYNHGVHGMEKAVKKVGARDIGEIIQKYNSRSFKFASKNFYAEFLAALEVSRNYRIYFGEINFEPPMRYVEYRLPSNSYFKHISRILKLPEDVIREFNPSLKKRTLQSQRRIPRGYKLKIPYREDAQYGVAWSLISGHEKYALNEGTNSQTPQLAASEKSTAVKRAERESSQKNSVKESLRSFALPKKAEASENSSYDFVKVGSNETLGHFADWLKISTRELRRINGLSFGEPIRMDQKIKLSFKNVTRAEFDRKRIEYRQAQENNFFSRYQIKGLKMHRVKSGDNIWDLCNNRYNVPYWLVAKYNPDRALNKLKVGELLIFPLIEMKEETSQ
ncbi:MAG: transglycosylase SLT domain-containing protein [Calditrichaeota bacterium]|nr:transglycosylase SLT domain-containing protein [Calditrichota bacterium]